MFGLVEKGRIISFEIHLEVNDDPQILYFYFSYNPHKIYIRDMPFFLQKEKDVPNLSFRSLPIFTWLMEW